MHSAKCPRPEMLYRSLQPSSFDPLKPSLSAGDLRACQRTFHFLFVADFEANCERDQPIQPLQEITEFSGVLFDMAKMEEVATFQEFVKPKVVPTLTPFCTELTGIIQADVENAPSFEEVLLKFEAFLRAHGLLDGRGRSSRDRRWAFATIGDWDIKTLLRTQAAFYNVALPDYFEQWINLKLTFRDVFRYYPWSMTSMLKDLNVLQMGRLHSGIDDAKNTCQIVRQLARRGANFRLTSTYFGRYPGYRGEAVTHVQNKDGDVLSLGGMSPPRVFDSPSRPQQALFPFFYADSPISIPFYAANISNTL
ncbi:hypothetical protein QR680_017476 [Steinernema hermaphroditum]|uniref:Exonuclease domain-containing protein n=1 Tax=Steinernema hermaphroditum TaxID=289476 RepID=A0AA39HFA9_9BILA|nr:hypothetical protein QR680_017476 [Steinernema hermaphroditum]